jgi:hypothetical protein
MGIGRMWSPKTGWGNASDVLAQNELALIEYKPKEVRKIRTFFSLTFILIGLNHD